MPSPSPLGRLRFLDVLRGLAALYVVVGHACFLLHESLKGYRAHPEDYGILAKIGVHALGLFGHGHAAVIFFFVLSGFAIHLRHARDLALQGQAARLGIGSYFLKRIKRLYPPLLFALALTWACDTWGNRLGLPISDIVGPTPHDAKTLRGNLAFLMDNWGGTPFACFGSDKPLWSLRYEAAFYLLYPALWFLNRAQVWLVPAVALGLFVVLGLSSWATRTLPSTLWQPFQLLFVWWLGALLADVFTGRISLRLEWFIFLLAALPLGLRLPGRENALLPDPWSQLALGLGFAGLIAAGLARARKKVDSPKAEGAKDDTGRPRLIASLFMRLGDCSYTLYVCHMPVLVLLGGWLMSRSVDHRLPNALHWVPLGTLLCILLAWLAHHLTELPFIGSAQHPKRGAFHA